MGDSQARKKKGGSRKSLIRDACGAVAVYVAIVTPVLFGVGALTLDIGRLITLHTELQAAADAAAIAGARELDRFPGAIAKAKEAAAGALANIQTFATGSKQAILDTTTLQNDCGLNPALGVPCIRFLRSLPQDDPPTRGDDLPIASTDYIDPTAGSQDSRDGEARFIDVHIEARDVTNILVRLLMLMGQTPLLVSTTSATAVAGQDQVICNLPPMFICNPTEPTGNTNVNLAMDANALSGRELKLFFQGGGGTMTPGNFGLLCPLGSEDEAPNCGAKSIKDALASKTGTCLSQQLVTTKTGASIGPVRAGINARFDYFEPQAKTADNVAWRTLDDFVPAGNVTQQGKAPGSAGGGSTKCEYKDIDPVDGNEVAREFPRDSCFPDNCGTDPNNINGSDRVGNGDWAYQEYFNINHPCNPAVPPCAGSPGWKPSDWDAVTSGAGWPPTRYDTYRYELERTPDAVTMPGKPLYDKVTGVPIVDAGGIPIKTAENGHQECFQGNPPTYPTYTYFPDKLRDLRLLKDRRVMTIAIANCNALEANGISTNGKFSFEIPEFIYVFLPEVMDEPSQSQIYAEILGTLDEGAIEALVRDVVQIYRRGR